MTSKPLMQWNMFNDLLSVRAVMDVPVDAGDDGVVVTVSVKTLSTDARTEVVIVLLAGLVSVRLVVIVVDIVVRAVIAFELFLAVSCMVDVRVMPISLDGSLRFCC